MGGLFFYIFFYIFYSVLSSGGGNGKGDVGRRAPFFYRVLPPRRRKGEREAGIHRIWGKGVEFLLTITYHIQLLKKLQEEYEHDYF